jgi:hypothetical protein
MFEAMCLGKATVVLPQTRKEEALANFVFERGALLGVGASYLNIQDEKMCLTIASRASELSDGQGANRITKIVESLL